MLPPGYKNHWLTVLMETSCELAAVQGPWVWKLFPVFWVKNLLCAESKSPSWFSYSPLAAYLCDSGSRSQTLATTTTLPISKTLPNFPSHLCPLAIQRGRFCQKQTTTNKKTKVGRGVRGGGVYRGRTSVCNNCEEQFQTDVCLDLALGSCPR